VILIIESFMLGAPEYIGEDDWTSVVDDIDHFQLSEKAAPFIPLSKAITRFECVEETKEATCSLVVQMVPAFS